LAIFFVIFTATFSTATLAAAPIVSRLTPPSLKFSENYDGPPYVARFVAGQRFDLQATIRPDAGQEIRSAKFYVNDQEAQGIVTLLPCDVEGLPPGTVAPTLRAYSSTAPGVHTLKVIATQSDGTQAVATGNFEIVALPVPTVRPAKNIIIMIGDGMGIAHRTAARIVYCGIRMGKTIVPLEMDDMRNIALVKTASLNSIITDSAAGAACYTTGNKNNNNQLGVFPDDTTDAFDNPRIELLGEFLTRTLGRRLGIVTTADISDATPAAFGSHSSQRNAGTGICDGFFEEQVPRSKLHVLMGGGRKWFLPKGALGSQRDASRGAIIRPELAKGWGLRTRARVDAGRDLIAAFEQAGFTYAQDLVGLSAAPDDKPLLGLFAYSNMNVAKDKIDGRRGVVPPGLGKTVVNAYGFPNQPLLEEMTHAALRILNHDNANGFTLLVEAASIDKQAHGMDSERWILDTIEFDKAVGVAKKFAKANPDTLIIVTADHECSGASILGTALPTVDKLESLAKKGKTKPLQAAVSTYDGAGFPHYTIHADGYPQTTEIDHKILISYAANGDRYESWRANPLPLADGQQPSKDTPYGKIKAMLPQNAADRKNHTGGFKITGHLPGHGASHTGTDIPLSATGRGANLFCGVIENTDVFFLAIQASYGGTQE
jgi:alkaline phosphatase